MYSTNQSFKARFFFCVVILQTTECLCMLGCDVDAVSDTKHTPLQVMLMKDRMECVYELFCYGADCNIGDSNGDTPLHWAVQVGWTGS